MWQRLRVHSSPALNRPVLLVSLSTSIPQYRAMYSQARELANYMMRKMKFVSLASLYSSALPPEVEVREDGTVSLTMCGFYLSRGERDLILLAGDSSPLDDQYQFTDVVLDYAKRAGVKEMFSVGPRWTDAPISPSQTPEVLGFANDAKGVEELKSNGVGMIKEEPAPFFASMVVGMAMEYGMRGYKVSVNHGEPLPHARSVAKMLEVLSRMIGFQIDLAELEPKKEAPSNLRVDGSGVYQ